MFRFLRTTLRPAGYHGHGKKPPFFEGWYYKVIDAPAQHRYAIIPGIFLGVEPAQSHAFVQMLDGQSGQVTYRTYPVDDFCSANGTFDIRIGPNRFTTDYLEMHLEEPGNVIRGALHFTSVQPWPVTLRAPGIIGWYAWVPFMQCYHGVVSLDHTIDGTLTLNQRRIDFRGGRGYTEKDWGRAFPASWVWLQTNHFAQPGTSLTASLAIIPWVRRAFLGFIIGLWHKRRLYRFATYTGARITQLHMTDTQVHWVVRDKRYELALQATRPARSGLLYAPEATGIRRRIAETLGAVVRVQLSAVGSRPRLLFCDTGQHAGMEMNGDLDQLVAMWAAAEP